MKKLIFTLLSFFAFQLAYSQTEYYWVGGVNGKGGASSTNEFNNLANWNTKRGGIGGAERTAAASTDVLIFDGTDISDASGLQSGAIVIGSTSGSTVGRLILQNGADVSFSRPASGTTTITVGDSPEGDDLTIDQESKLRIRGTTGGVNIVLNSNAGPNNSPLATTSATALIQGQILLEEGTSTSAAQNRLTSRQSGKFVFASGASLTTLPTYLFNPFGTANAEVRSANGGIAFEPGSSFFYGGGGSPFGTSSQVNFVNFKPGSKFYFNAANATNMFNGRAYGDMIVSNGATVTADGSLYKVDSLRIEAGSTFITHTSGSTPISGHILNNGTFRVPAADPNRNNRLVMVGSTPQNISGTGTYTFADFIISNVSHVSLQRTIQVDSTTIIYGVLSPNGNLTGPGTVVSKPPATYNVTGNINVDSFLVKNISDFTGIEVGMSVTGTNIESNTVVTNFSSSAGTISLSKPATGSTYASSTSLTISNSQGVLPIRFGNTAATLNNGQVTVSWKVLTETDVTIYVIEKSADGITFTEAGSVSARGSQQYNFIDVNPLGGNNFYRIKSISNNGEVKYTSIMRVSNSKGKAVFSAYPNPVVNKTLNLQLGNLQKGNYTVQLFNNLGQAEFSKVINAEGGSSNQTLQLPPGVKTGTYKLTLRGNDVLFQQTLVVQ